MKQVLALLAILTFSASDVYANASDEEVPSYYAPVDGCQTVSDNLFVLHKVILDLQWLADVDRLVSRYRKNLGYAIDLCLEYPLPPPLIFNNTEGVWESETT